MYTLTTEPPHVAASAQVSASGLVAAPCSCRLLSHQTLLWHHRLGHPSPPPPCLPCIEGRQCAAHHSSFPPTTAPLQTLHMDVWGPGRVSRQGHEGYFLLVVDDYTRYTTLFPLRSKGEVLDVLIPWICAVRLQLREDLPVLRLHSNRGGEFSSNLLRDFFIEVARTSMVHAAAPHFLWSFAVRYAAHQLNLWPRVSLPETSSTLRWTGKVGDASVFWVWGSRSFVRDTSADKLSSHAIPCVFLGFSLDAPGWQFYHPTSRRVLPSQDVTFDEVLLPKTQVLLEVLRLGFLRLGVLSLRVRSQEGAESKGAEPAGAEPGGAESEGAESEGAERRGIASAGAKGSPAGGLGAGGAGATSTGGARTRGAGAAGAGASSPGGARTRGTGAVGASGVGGAGAGGAGAGDIGAGGAGAGDPSIGGANAGGTGAGGTGVGGAGAGDTGAGGAGVGGTGAGDPGARGAGAGCAGAGSTGAEGTLDSPLLAPSPYAEQTDYFTERREPESRPASPVRAVCTCRRVPRPRPPVPITHIMALRPSSVPLRDPLLPPPASSLPAILDPESDLAHAASPTFPRLLATVVIDPSFESTSVSTLVAELVEFAAACSLDYASSLGVESESDFPLSIGGELLKCCERE
ncbi:unnamed protein product [Closterium sp. NIES-54]